MTFGSSLALVLDSFKEVIASCKILERLFWWKCLLDLIPSYSSRMDMLIDVCLQEMEAAMSHFRIAFCVVSEISRLVLVSLEARAQNRCSCVIVWYFLADMSVMQMNGPDMKGST